MNAKVTCSILCLCLAAGLPGQQPNSANHSMTIDGVDGPPFPIFTNVRTSLPATFIWGGLPNQPYALFQGIVHAGSSFVLNGVVDLFLNPFPALILDGFQNPAFHTDGTGAATFVVQVPNAGTPPNGVPLGLLLGEQSLIGDPFNAPYGISLTAATRVAVTQGPIINYYSLGDDGFSSIDLSSMPIPFYGINYTTIYLTANGYVCFGSLDGGGVGVPTASATGFVSEPPRIAANWCNLQCPSNSVKTTFDTNPGGTGSGVAGYLKIEWTNIQDFLSSNSHTFSLLLRSDGYLEVTFPPGNNASIYDEIVGIGPGGNIGVPQPEKNFTGPQPPGSMLGPGILSTPPFAYAGNANEAIFEWFGIPGGNGNYGNSYSNSYDLFAVTLHFLPAGAGSLPGATDRYTLY